MRNIGAWLVSSFVFLALGGSWIWADHAGKSVRVYRTEGPIKVDGVLDETAWREAGAISDFVQQEPKVDEPATEKTEVRLILSGGALYVGVECFDSEAGKIIARERRRDNNLRDDDRFEIVLDTFHDHRNAFYFVTNPLGTRFDALITDEGVDVNREWDERWWVEARMTPRGWTLEFEIPLAILRASPEQDVWGINFQRFIRRKTEIAFWTGWNRDFSFVQVSQAGHLEGMRGTQAGLRARIKPYLLGGFRHHTLESGRRGFENSSEAGLEVAKVGITPSLIAEFTANTDFAQVEVDEAVVNLTRFPLFFAEKREFFLEHAGIFDFSLGGRRGFPNDRILQMFFSRRIGLTADRRPVPVIGGAKVTGRVQGLDVGLLDVQTDQFGTAPGSNYAIARVKKNILARSNFGVFFSNRQSGRTDDTNRVAGADVNFTFFKNFDIQGSLGRSFTGGVNGDQKMGRLKLNLLSDIYELFLEHLYLGDDFRHDIGFVQRNGIRRTQPTILWKPRLRSRSIRNLVFRQEVLYFSDTHNHLLDRQQVFQFAVSFRDDSRLRFNTTHNLERLRADFRINPQVTIPQSVYRFRNYFVEYDSPPQHVTGIRTHWEWGNFYGGKRRILELGPSFKPWPGFSSEFSYQFNDLDLPQGSFRTHVVNSRFNVSLNNRWLTTAIAQYDSASKRVVFFFRLRFIYRPGDDLYVVFNQTSGVGPAPSDADRAFLVKFTRSFEF
ncbi:MAG: carbohydrate binding family 9 domain-containing protein [Acidobacteria bacterium]|nr:carbohydrate binding family 9 domain-containing protein [Acidobacteriota bacterium]